MKIFTFALFILIISIPFCNIYSQDRRSIPLLIEREEKISGVKKDKIFSKAQKWLKNEKDVNILRYSKERGVIEAQGIMLYENDVKLENVFLSPNAALRTRGTIKFLIRITCEDEKYKIEFTDFEHEAYESRYGKISFGTIVQNDKVPLGKCYEHTTWCNAVWDDMRTKIRRHSAMLGINAKDKIK